MPRIAIVVGHNVQSQGAVRVTDRASEYVWNGDLAERIQKLDPENVKVFRRTPGPGEVSRVYRQVAAWGPDVAVEVHFNGHRSSSANGCEVVHGRSRASRELAEHLQDHILGTLGNRDRKIREPYDGRGSTAVNQTSQPTALIEPYFGSNVGECGVSEERKDELARAVLNGARAFLGKAPVVTVAPEEVDAPDDEMQRMKDAYEEIGDLIVSTLATGYFEGMPEDLARMRWRLAEIFQMVSRGT